MKDWIVGLIVSIPNNWWMWFGFGLAGISLILSLI